MFKQGFKEKHKLKNSSYYFSFYDEDGNRIYYAHMLSGQCCHQKPNGQRCKNRAVIAFEFCHSHLETELHLQLKQSTIANAGKGIFAKDKTKAYGEPVFERGDFICEYNGELLNAQQLVQQYEYYTAPYAVELKKNQYIDSAVARGVGAMINHKNNERFCNTKWSVSHAQNKITLKATKEIYDGDELFLHYGDDYDFNDGSSYKLRTYPTKT